MFAGARAGFPAPRRNRARGVCGAEAAGAMQAVAVGLSAQGICGAEAAGSLITNAIGYCGAKARGAIDTKATGFCGAEAAGSLQAAAPAYPNGFENYLEFLLPVESVKGGGTLNNCLLCIDDTFADLRTVANGGHVEHASGYDMRLELADGTVVPFARLAWAPSTGRIVLRARVASLPAADTRLRLFFGKTVASDGASPGGAYAAHLAAPDLVTGADRTGLSRTWTPTGISAGALAGYAATLNGTTSQLVRANPTELNGLAAITIQAFVQLTSVAADVPILMAGPTAGTDLGLMLYFHAATGRLIFRLATSGGTTEVQSPDGAMPAVGTPMLVAATWTSGQAPKLFVGGEIVTLAVAGTALTGTTNATLGAATSEALIGHNRLTGARLAGQIADLMVSARALSGGHLQTQELNYLTPRDSYGVGERNGADVVNLSPVVPPIFATATVGSASVVDVATETYEGDTGQTKTLESLTGTGGGTANIVAGRASFTAELRGLAQAFTKKIVRLATAECNADLGDARCKINLQGAAYRTTAEIAEIDVLGRLKIESGTSFADRWFERGQVEVLSGASSGMVVMVYNMTKTIRSGKV